MSTNLKHFADLLSSGKTEGWTGVGGEIVLTEQFQD